MTLGHAFVGSQQQYPGHPDKAADHADSLVMVLDSDLAPTVKVENAVLLVNRARHSLVEQGESTFDRGDVNREIRTIENQYLAVEQGGSHRMRHQAVR